MEKMPLVLDVTGPNCGNCPFSWDAKDGNLYCRRFPPVSSDTMIPVGALPREQQLRLPPDVAKAGFVQAKQSAFPATQAHFVCGEHPEAFPELDEEETPIKAN